MSNNPINSYDIDGGWSDDLTGAALGGVVGTALGSLAAHLIVKNNPNMKPWLKDLLEVGLPLAGGLVGAGLGYGIGQSQNPGTKGVDDWQNSNNNFFTNVRAFYKGLFVGGNEDLGSPKNQVWGSDCNGNTLAEVPGLPLPKIQIEDFHFAMLLPKWTIWNKPGSDNDRFNRDNYTNAGLLWRDELSAGDGHTKWFFSFRRFTFLSSLAVGVPAPILIAPELLWPAYWILRHIIIKPIIHISIHRRHQ